MIYSDADANEMVAAGGKWLDEHLTPNWPWNVSIKELNIADGCDCILGQLYSRAVIEADDATGYDYAVMRYEMPLELRCHLGFTTRATSAGYSANIATLNQAWRHLIASRRAVAPA